MKRLPLGLRRLLRLADYLETVPPNEFDMNIWVCESGCGTSGCAAYHASRIPTFRRAGLTMVDCGGFGPAFGNLQGLSALQDFFSIDIEESRRLFLADGFTTGTPKQVARSLRRFVQRKLKELEG